MMYVTAVIPAAGRGLRLGGKGSKPLIDIAHKPLLIRTLSAINSHPSIKEIIVVVNSADRNKIKSKIKEYRLTKVKAVVLGGARRQDSVRAGIQSISKRAGLVLIHDAARPFIAKDIISRAIDAAEKNGAAIAGVPVKATIKRVISHKSHF